jgi:hypothetical protein
MQVISGYNNSCSIKFIQQLRLYNFSRPSVKKWRATRHGKKFILDSTDSWLLSQLKNNKLAAVDCAGWYFNNFDVDTQCFESNDIAKLYYPDCYIEYDVFSHRPTYIDDDRWVFFKNSWFLKYAQFQDFVNFLNIWTRSTVILEFEPIYIQHNHLKYNLIDLVRRSTNLNIDEINFNLWMITSVGT